MGTDHTRVQPTVIQMHHSNQAATYVVFSIQHNTLPPRIYYHSGSGGVRVVVTEMWHVRSISSTTMDTLSELVTKTLNQL